VLTSATLSEDVDRLKKLVLNNPVVLKLSEPQLPDSSQLTQVIHRYGEQLTAIVVDP
jgi:superfamily II DNA/RNA helicase